MLKKICEAHLLMSDGHTSTIQMFWPPPPRYVIAKEEPSVLALEVPQEGDMPRVRLAVQQVFRLTSLVVQTMTATYIRVE